MSDQYTMLFSELLKDKVLYKCYALLMFSSFITVLKIYTQITLNYYEFSINYWHELLHTLINHTVFLLKVIGF